MEINPFIFGLGVGVSGVFRNNGVSNAWVATASEVEVSVLGSTIKVGVLVNVGDGTVDVALGTSVRVFVGAGAGVTTAPEFKTEQERVSMVQLRIK